MFPGIGRAGHGRTSSGSLALKNHSCIEREGVLFNTNLKLAIEPVSFTRATFLERFGVVVKTYKLLKISHLKYLAIPRI